MSSEFDNVLKILVIGDSHVGKSCLWLRFADGSFTEPFIPNIGVDIKTRTLHLDGQLLKIQKWDTAGQERFRAITKAYYRSAYGVVIVYDVTDEVSFKDLKMWLDQVEAYGDQGINKLLVGNKCDLTSKRQVDYVTAKEYAEKLGIPLVETSAKDGTNVEQAFVKLALDIKKRVFDQTKDNEGTPSNLNLKPNTSCDQESWRCC